MPPRRPAVLLAPLGKLSAVPRPLSGWRLARSPAPALGGLGQGPWLGRAAASTPRETARGRPGPPPSPARQLPATRQRGLVSAACIFSTSGRSRASWGSEPRSPGRRRVPFRVLSDGRLFEYVLPREVPPAACPRRNQHRHCFSCSRACLATSLCLLCGAFNFREIRLITPSPCGVSAPSGAFATLRSGQCSLVSTPGSHPHGPGLGRQSCVLRLMSSCQAHSEPLLTDGFGLSDSEAHTARCLRGCGVLVSLASVPQPHLSQGCSGCAGPWQGRTSHRLFAEAREKPWELSPGRGGTGREQQHSFQPKNAGCLPCFSFFTCFSEAPCGFQ